jgi:type IV secretory pathway TrbF-like protein
MKEKLKSLIFRSPMAESAGSDSLPDGAKNSDNPYLTARRTWNNHVGSVVSSRQTWQVVGIGSLLIALAAVGGVIHIGSKSKFIPYVIEVDKLGQQRAVGPADEAAPADPRVIQAAVADFISCARLVTPDVALQRKAVFCVYSKLAPNDPATAKMNQWLNSNEEASPFKRAEKHTVSIEITSVLPQTKETWQVDWVETISDRQGGEQTKPYRMRALVMVYTAEPTADTTDEQMRRNPGNVFVRDFSWSKQV